MSRERIIEILLVVLILIPVIIFTIVYFTSSQKSSPLKNSSSKTTTKGKSVNPIVKKVDPLLPINVANETVKNANITYTIDSTIVKMTPTSKGLQLFTDIPVKDNQELDFYVTPKTKVYEIKNNEQILSTSSALMKNQHISLTLSYNLRMKTPSWSVSKIVITPPDSATPTKNNQASLSPTKSTNK